MKLIGAIESNELAIYVSWTDTDFHDVLSIFSFKLANMVLADFGSVRKPSFEKIYYRWRLLGRLPCCKLWLKFWPKVKRWGFPGKWFSPDYHSNFDQKSCLEDYLRLNSWPKVNLSILRLELFSGIWVLAITVQSPKVLSLPESSSQGICAQTDSWKLGSAKPIFNICSYFADRLAALKWDNVAKEINKREFSTYIYLHM